MPLTVLSDWGLFATVVLGGGAALAPSRPDLSALESWCCGVAFAVAVLAGTAFAAYTLSLPVTMNALGYGVLAATALVRRRRATTLWHADEVRETFIVWALVSTGALALLACVFSYSGGAWMGDWEEHYQRPLLLLGLRPEDEAFRRLFPFTSRPPLANLADAALLRVVGADFAHHQVMMLLLNSLAFLPVSLFARSFGGGRAAAAGAGLLCLLCPLFLQNLTYPWTKLITAFFVLTALHLLFVRPGGRARPVLGFSLFALGVLTHYSAGVWLLVFGGAWLLVQRPQWAEVGFRRTAALAALAGTLLVLPWFGYAIARYGIATTLGSNSVYQTASHYSWNENLLSAGPKLWHTLVPHPLRQFDRSVLDQANRWTHFRDLVFSVYQSNLFFGLGSGALLLAATALGRPSWRPALPRPQMWLVAVPAVVLLGTSVHGHVDSWGLAHICLQPLVLLGVALAAAQLPRFAAGRARILAIGAALLATADLALGIGLHYAATAMQLNRPDDQPLFVYAGGLSAPARYNLGQKLLYGQDYFMDTVPLSWWAALLVYAGILALVAARGRRLGHDRA